MTPANDPPADTAGMAGHLVFVIDAAAPVLVQQAGADAATTLAAQTGMPVTVATAPVDRLDALRDTLGRDADARTREYAPPPRPDLALAMSSAPFVWTDGGAAVRIFLAPVMNFGRLPSTTPSGPPSRGFSHHGHSHGPGTGWHAH